MSRIGKMPIIISSEVTVKIDSGIVMVSGPKGNISFPLPPGIDVKIDNGQAVCKVAQNASKQNLSNWGLARTLIANGVFGVKDGWTKTLELQGVGYRAAVEGNTLVLNVGFSHQVRIEAPSGITFSVLENKINVTGADKQLVGEMAAKIRRIRPPEPYKGKGIRYLGEVIRRKIGKAAKTVGAGTGGK